MKQPSPLKIALVVLLSWVLAACGGGAGGGAGGFGETEEEPVVDPSTNLILTLTLVDVLGEPIDPPNLDADTPGTLKATVTNGEVEGVIVLFATDLGDLFPASGLTDINGVTTASLTAGSTPGAGQATATIQVDGQSFDSDSLTFSTLGNAGDTDITLTLTFTDATPGDEANIVTNSEPSTLDILVADAAGTPLPNRTMDVTTNPGSTGNGCLSGT